QFKEVYGFKEHKQVRARSIQSLVDRFDRGEQPVEDIFLNTETLWGRLAKRDIAPYLDEVVRFLRAIKEAFPGYNLKIVLHLRRIDLYLESLFQQGVKAGRLAKLDNLQRRVLAKRAF